MDYDRILIHLGEFGTWQRRNYFLLWLPTLAAGINIMTAAWSVMTPRKGKSSAKCFPMIRKGKTQIKPRCFMFCFNEQTEKLFGYLSLP